MKPQASEKPRLKNRTHQAEPSPGIRVLILDDETHICEILSRSLASHGYSCQVAASAKEAWQRLQESEFALLISDISMPGESGLDFLVRVKHHFKHQVAVLMITAVDDHGTAVSALERGAYGYLIKPFEENEVLINVANALERRRLTLESRDYAQRLEKEVRQRTADVRNREAEIVLRLISASEYRDDETGAHIRRVGLYVGILAAEAGRKDEDVDLIQLAAPMHDVGKIGVPDAILRKPGKLTAEEFERVKEHTVIGARILSGSNIPLLRIAHEIAYCHHERWDGTGYPRGLSGEQIPQCARLVAIVDVYDALVSDRPYRPAFPNEQAVSMMTAERGTHFDPRLFDIFLTMLPGFHQAREHVRAAPFDTDLRRLLAEIKMPNSEAAKAG